MTEEMTGRRLVSIVLLAEMDRAAKGETTPEQFHYLVDVLERNPFLDGHPQYFPAVRQLFEKMMSGESE